MHATLTYQQPILLYYGGPPMATCVANFGTKFACSTTNARSQTNPAVILERNLKAKSMHQGKDKLALKVQRFLF